MNYYQLLDLDGEQVGILKTTLESDIIQKEWSEYVDEYSDDVDDFAEHLCEKHGENVAERFYIDLEIAP